MTRQVRTHVKCQACDVELLCPQCGEMGTTMTPFSHWLRGLAPPLDSKMFDNQNLDYIWHNYRQAWFITLEEKRYGKRSSQAQMDTHNIVAQMLTLASPAWVSTLRGLRKVEYRGHYVVIFDKTSPDDSRIIFVNEQEIDKAMLLSLLTYGHLP